MEAGEKGGGGLLHQDVLQDAEIKHHESIDWLRYEVRRHVVSELESLATSGRNPAAASSTEGAGIVEASVSLQGAGPWRLDKTPRSIEALVESLCQENSRFLTPFGNDFEKVPLGTRLNGGECFRRLLCFRFDVEYTSLPLGAKELQAFALEACERERKAPEECGGWTADEIAEALQRGSEAHVWLLLLLTRTGEVFASVDWSERAEQFTLFLQAAALKSLLLAETLRQMRRGQLLVLALW